MRVRIAWRICDGRRGHEVQSLGLLEALAARLPLKRHDLELPAGPGPLAALRMAVDRGLRALPGPDLLVAAGHRSHLALLAVRARFGGRAVVLMRPSLPARLFDLCVVPAHDGLAAGPRLLVTRGVLNRVRPGTARDPRRGLILLGGPSRHHRWETRSVLAQVAAICDRDRELAWTAATSRRSPARLAADLGALARPNLEVVEHHAVGPDWLPGVLGATARVWVSEDSVSMVYEALSAGAATGLIELARAGRRDRVAAGVEALVSDDLVVRFSAWQGGRALVPPGEPLAEAARCAAWIAERWLGAG